MFGFGRRKMKTSAAMDLPRQPIAPPVIHNHNQTPWPGIILTGFACLIFSLPLLWFVLVFLLDQIGYRNPERGAAFLVVGLPFGGAGLWIISWFIGNIFDIIFGHVREIVKMVVDANLEMEHTRLLTVQSNVDEMRINSEDAPFARLILAVMYDAYKKGSRGMRGEVRWSRRYAKALANQHGLNLSERRCGEVAKWLLDHNVITEKDQINRAQFNDLGSVKALVSRVYNIPVNMVADVGMSGHHLRGVGKDQWNNPLSSS